MSKKLIYLASMVNVLNLEVCKTYSIRSARKVSLFRDFVLAVFLSVACSLLTAMPVAYGEEGYALEVNGGTVTIDDDEDALRLSSYTYEFWMKDLEGPTGSWRNVFCKGPGDTAAGRGPLVALRPDEPGLHFSHSTGTSQETIDTHEGVPVNEWTHIALVLTSLNGEQIIYQDGVQVAVESASNLTDATQSSVLRIGLGANVVLDDFRVWNYARTQAEIQADMNREIFGVEDPDGLVPGTTYYWRIDEVNDTEPNSPWKGPVWSFWIPPRKAYEPVPPDGAKYIDQNVVLSWTTGFGVKFHTVYFGDNFDDVNNAVVGIPQPATTYTPGTVELEKTYYWRVDEFDGLVTYKGDLWSFKTLPDIPITDPNLVGWWKLDEGSGTTVLDRSGHGNHGALQGDPQWVIGYDADALMFDGVDDWVEVPHADILTVDSEVTVMAWIYTERHTGPPGQDYQGIVAKGNSIRSYSLYTQAAGTLHFSTTSEDAYVGSSSSDLVPLNEWVHVAAMVVNGSHLFYINGEPAGEGGGGITLPGAADTANVVIGRTQEGSTRSFLGMIDDVRIYNKALTQDEIEQVMRSDPTLAWGPSPANGSTPYIRDVTPLSWSPGDSASQHDIYFGTDRDAVADADASDTAGVYRGRQGVTIYTPSESVEWGGGPYYWRVDEYNTDATISKGNVWSFTVADFIGIDDFEDYNDYEPDRIFETWIDGWGTTTNGSEVGYAEPDFPVGEHHVETTIVHGGGQSMPYFYENNFKYSEATMTLSYPRNWTEEEVGVLSLWFYGDASNAAERMYVAVNGIAVVYHDNPNAAQIDTWTEWPINLQEFAVQGVNLANVNTISIGFGDKNNLQAGGSGLVFFDDIRLYQPAPPEPEPEP